MRQSLTSSLKNSVTMADHSQQSQEIPSQIDLTSYLADVGIFSECLAGASGRDVALWASEHVGAAFGWARSVEQTSSMIMQEDDAEVDEELRRQHAASSTRGPGGASRTRHRRTALFRFTRSSNRSRAQVGYSES